MKVSILTYHWEDNYGATMQAYATYKIINELGHVAEFIDLRLPYRPNLRSRLVFALKRHRFNAFRRKFFKNLTPIRYRSVEQLKSNPPKSDCYLVGSDQTWNPNICKSLLPAYFLTFGDENVKRVSYATSIGLEQWVESQYITNNEITKALQRFRKILLRERSAIEITNKVFNNDATQVIDPVLLFPSYPELTGEIKLSDEMIVYKLIDNHHFYKICRSVAETKKLPIRSIGSIRRLKGYKTSYPERVEDWIKRLASAKYLITDSFHGTVFAILYKRPFAIYVGDPKRLTRIQSLLEQFDLGYRILKSDASPSDLNRILESKIDWDEVYEKLSKLRGESISLLKQVLNE